MSTSAEFDGSVENGPIAGTLQVPLSPLSCVAGSLPLVFAQRIWTGTPCCPVANFPQYGSVSEHGADIGFEQFFPGNGFVTSIAATRSPPGPAVRKPTVRYEVEGSTDLAGMATSPNRKEFATP